MDKLFKQNKNKIEKELSAYLEIVSLSIMKIEVILEAKQQFKTGIFLLRWCLKEFFQSIHWSCSFKMKKMRMRSKKYNSENSIYDGEERKKING